MERINNITRKRIEKDSLYRRGENESDMKDHMGLFIATILSFILFFVIDTGQQGKGFYIMIFVFIIIGAIYDERFAKKDKEE